MNFYGVCMSIGLCAVFSLSRVQKLTWEEQCVWGRGLLISKLQIVNLLSCKNYIALFIIMFLLCIYFSILYSASKTT